MLGQGRDIVSIYSGRTMREIAEYVALERGVSLVEMVSPSRERPIAWARQEAMARIHATRRYSLNQIGQFFGGRDHTTVLHGVRRAAERAERENRP